MYINYNPNPKRQLIDDCVIRAICKVTDRDWLDIYFELMMEGSRFYDWPMKNYIWGHFLKNIGFVKQMIPDFCPDCYTVKEFCEDNPVGDYILAMQNHVVAVRDGNYYDTVDTGDEVPLYYWQRKEIS